MKGDFLKETELFLLDLDGTVYLDGSPIGRMTETLRSLRSAGKRLCFLTNNSSRTEEEYRLRLTRMGLFGRGDFVFTSASAAVMYLRERYEGAKVYLVSTEAVRREVSAAGISLTEEAPDVCLLAYDTEITFAKLKRLDFFLKRGVPFLATHPDDVCPTSYGSMPDVGSFLALLERSSGRTATIIGKPMPHMGRYLTQRTGVTPAHMCMVGDRMHTDIRFANACGMRSILVLSGETAEEDIAKYPDSPDLVLKDLNRLTNFR